MAIDLIWIPATWRNIGRSPLPAPHPPAWRHRYRRAAGRSARSATPRWTPPGSSRRSTKSHRPGRNLIYNIWHDLITSSTAQGGGGSFKNRKPIGEVVCCESGMAERSHWWTERCLISLTLFLSFSLFLSVSLSFSDYLPTYWSICLPIYLPVCLSISLSIYLPI